MATGQRTSYTDTTPIVRTISDLIDMIDWKEAPLLKLLGLDNASRFRLLNWPNTKYSWLNDTMSTRSGTLDEADDGSETALDLQSGEGALLKEGDVIQVGTELMYVSSVATDTITVVRGFGASTAAAHDDDAVWTLVTSARLEGAQYDTGHTTTVSESTNYTQILSESVKVTGSEAIVPKYGIDDTMAYHVSKLLADGNKAGKLAILLNQIFYYGRYSAGSATVARAAGGVQDFITTNTTALATAALTRKHIEDEMETCMLAGGTPDCLIMNSWLRRKISSFYEGSIRTERSEDMGGSTIKTVSTDFGDMEVVFDRWCPTDTIYVIRKDDIGWITYRPFQVIDRAPDGDYTVKEVLGEYGFVVRNENGMAIVSGASTTT